MKPLCTFKSKPLIHVNERPEIIILEFVSATENPAYRMFQDEDCFPRDGGATAMEEYYYLTLERHIEHSKSYKIVVQNEVSIKTSIRV